MSEKLFDPALDKYVVSHDIFKHPQVQPSIVGGYLVDDLDIHDDNCKYSSKVDSSFVLSVGVRAVRATEAGSST